MGSSSPPLKGAYTPNFCPCALWPNGWMDQNATWYVDRPWPRRHCVRWGPSSPNKRDSPQFSAHVCCGQTVAHLNYCWALVAQFTAVCPYTLQWATPPPKNCPFAWGSVLASNAWFLGPTGVHSPNSIPIGSAFLQGSRSWQTGRQTTTLMRPNNIRHY